MQVKSPQELKRLFEHTSFIGKSPSLRSWGRIKVDETAPFKLTEVPYVAECTYFGETQICLAGTYEGHNEDCLFIKELVRLYAEGQLIFRADR